MNPELKIKQFRALVAEKAEANAEKVVVDEDDSNWLDNDETGIWPANNLVATLYTSLTEVIEACDKSIDTVFDQLESYGAELEERASKCEDDADSRKLYDEHDIISDYTQEIEDHRGAN
jgi:hypothetical protein